MLSIGILICVVLILIFQAIVHDLQSMPDPPSFKNESNVSLSSLLSDSLVNTWLDDSPKRAAWKVPHNQLSEKTTIELHDNSKYTSTYLYGFSNSTKENFIKSLLRPPSVEVEPDWSVVLGTFEYVYNDNWDNYLVQIELPYLLRLLVGSVSETVTISRILKNGKEDDTKGYDKKSLSNKFGTTSADFELRIAISAWPLTMDSQFRLGEPILEHDMDGSDSMNTFFFVAPRLLVQEKIKDLWKTVAIRHFDERGLNLTMIEREYMAVATRYFIRV